MLVLILDDDPDQREALRGLLEADGHQVLPSGSALDAIRLIREHWTEIDVAILDYYLGGTMSGADVARHIPRGVALFCVSDHTERDIRMTWTDPLGVFLAFFLKGTNEFAEDLMTWIRRVESSKEDTRP